MAKKTDEQTSAPSLDGYEPRFYTKFKDSIRAELMADLGLKNIMQVPRLTKIVLNMGVGEGSKDEKILQQAELDLAVIAGQKPRRTRARISVAAFKLRAGMPVGTSVTLRGPRMYEFLERLVCVAIPRIRDFRGLSPRAFDGRGNYNFGIREHQIFTEIDTTKAIPMTLGMNITLVTTAKTNDHCKALLKKFGVPLREG
jgi:large subunit ribosomal protein L5